MSANLQAEAETPYVLRQDEGGVVTLTMNRGERLNSLSQAMIAALHAELELVAGDSSARVVVLAGAGKAFCAGHDLKEMGAHPEKAWQKALFDQCGRMMVYLTRMPQPVIARVHGVATAAGCQLVSMCDLAVAVDSARFAVSGVNFGLFCSSPSVGLSRNVGRKQAMEMLLTGEFIDAPTALARGLLNRVVPADQLDAEIRRLSDSVLAKSPVAIRLGKRLFYEQLEQGLDGAYSLANEVMACNATAEDFAEGMDAFAKKRKPVWRGR
ncbi:MAG: enoyl-CoA hydratase [Betaproteobacteria bacterium]|nr:enoyl-CoA hydratase [Betaproteobacteria bacterium]